MPLQSLRVTRKEIDTYYNPKVSAFQRMTESINSAGYGQIIENYSNQEVLNTYYHEWKNDWQMMSVYSPLDGMVVVPEEAGPTFWRVSSQAGLDFLSGVGEIPGYRKLKYCVGCTDANGLSYQTIDNFKSRFQQLANIVYNYGSLDGFLFYDLDQPRYTNVYPSVKYDDGVNVSYFFKTIYGTDKSLEEMSTDTGYSQIQIELSISTAPVVKPQEGSNTVITSCCDGVSQVISGQNIIGSILYNGTLENSYCWYVESLTNDPVTIPPAVEFTSGGRSCNFCTTTYGCPPSCEDWFASYSTDPNAVCLQPFDNYTIAFNVSKIYVYGDCGGTLAPSGYYNDGRSIYYWDGITISDYGRCPSCEVRNFSFKPIPDFPSLCASPGTDYDYNRITGTLYTSGNCNGQIAAIGYYAENGKIYYFDGVTLSNYSRCK